MTRATQPWRWVVLLAICVPLGLLNEILPRYRVLTYQQLPPAADAHHATFLFGDCSYYRNTIRSLLDHGTLDLRETFGELHRFTFTNPPPGATPEFNVALGRGGEWFPKHPLLLPLVAAPFYALAGDDGLLAFNVLQLGVLAILVWLCARRHAPDGVAFAVTMLFSLGTLFRPAAYNFSPDVFSTLVVVAGYLAMVTDRAALAGALLGLAVWGKWSNIVFLPVAGAFFLTGRTRTRLIGRLALGATVPLVALLAVNHVMFGSPFVTPYDREIVAFHEGVPELGEFHREFFDVPFWKGLSLQVFHPSGGLLVSAPPILLGLAGLATLFRRAPREALTVGGFWFAQCAFFASYRPWYESNFGHRFLMTVVALAAIPASALVARVTAKEPPTGSP